jgi:hypothetical protein
MVSMEERPLRRSWPQQPAARWQCGGCSVVTDAYGNLIDVNALTGQRIYPAYADYAPNAAYANSIYNNGYVPAYTGYVPSYFYAYA